MSKTEYKPAQAIEVPASQKSQSMGSTCQRAESLLQFGEIMGKSKRKDQDDQYDSPWKDIIEQYFPEFMSFFFPQAKEEIDFDKGYEFLDKELQKVESGRHARCNTKL